MPAQLTRPISLPSFTAAWPPRPAPSASWLTSHLTKTPPISRRERFSPLARRSCRRRRSCRHWRPTCARRALAEARSAAGDDEDLACDVHLVCSPSIVVVSALLSAKRAHHALGDLVHRAGAARPCARNAVPRLRHRWRPIASSSPPAGASASGRPASRLRTVSSLVVVALDRAARRSRRPCLRPWAG